MKKKYITPHACIFLIGMNHIITLSPELGIYEKSASTSYTNDGSNSDVKEDNSMWDLYDK